MSLIKTLKNTIFKITKAEGLVFSIVYKSRVFDFTEMKRCTATFEARPIKRMRNCHNIPQNSQNNACFLNIVKDNLQFY